MKKIDTLIDIAEDLNLMDILVELNHIKDRFSSQNKELIIPIVGEFSSGKTTLINSLTNSRKLETASKATTSVIYEMYFGCEEEYAEIIYEDGHIEVLDNIESIINDSLDKVKLIRVYDTSRKLDKSTILVDTPGLSSNDPKHIESLSNYLPNSDALFLFIDINQQVTKSLLNFIEKNDLLHLPIFLVITKKDTKSNSEIEEIKNYISKNIKLSIENVISISSKERDLDEFFQLISKIQERKNAIIDNVLGYRLSKTAMFIKNHIENLILNSSSDATLENEIKNQKRSLDKLNNAIDKLVDDVANKLHEIEYNTAFEFEGEIFSKLDSLIAKNVQNIDNEAIGAINSHATIYFTYYQKQIRKKLIEIALDRRNTDQAIPLRSLESIDFSGLDLGKFSYNINLNGAGKSQVKNISNGIKIAAVAAAVYVTAGLAAGAVGGGASAATGAASTVAGTASSAGAVASGASTITAGANLASKAGMALNMVDTVSDVASIRSNRSTRKMISEQSQKAALYLNQSQANLELYNQYNSQVGQIISPEKNTGFVESIVGTATDSFLGKPQRKKLINSYLNETLIPEFKNKLSIISLNLLSDIQNSLHTEASVNIEQMQDKLQEMRRMLVEEKEAYNSFLAKLKIHLKTLKL